VLVDHGDYSSLTEPVAVERREKKTREFLNWDVRSEVQVE